MEKQMAFADFAPARPIAPRPFVMTLRAIATWFAAHQAQRARQATLQDLLYAPDHQLRDLGISRVALRQAMEIHRK
jgi:uncharacterized protein YjiS (DUF1127 family)